MFYNNEPDLKRLHTVIPTILGEVKQWNSEKISGFWGLGWVGGREE